MNFIEVPKSKYDNIYNGLNECNDMYEYVKFVLDTEQGQINVRDDEVIQFDICGM